MAQGEYAAALSSVARYDEALRAAERAAQLDPLSLDVMRWKSYIFYKSGDCGGARRIMERALAIEPNVGRFRYYYAMCVFETTGDAASVLPHAEAEPLGFAHATALAILYQALGEPQRAREQMDAMLVDYGDSASYQYGQVHAQWGENEIALAWLENAVKIRDPGIIQAVDDRLLAPLHGEPRFEQILRAIGRH